MVQSSTGDPLHDRQAARCSHGRPPVLQRLLFVLLLDPSTLLFPLRIPHSQGSSAFLRESTVCVLEMPDKASDSGASSRLCHLRWLVKLQESSLGGDVQLLSLFS
ncbi:hypothetical protein NL676_006453 [Syzygium grande]|nr:hypothetical protein NL676_006453 [Syzygium grande]